MRLKPDWNWKPSLSFTNPYRWVEWMLLLVAVVQAARFVWTVLAPVTPFGDWRPPRADIPTAQERRTLMSSVDPFFRSSTGGDTRLVTALDLKLFGTRLNDDGTGSAIIATPDGVQASYAPGDAILPGVTLKSVAFDHVVIERNGTAETLFLDQSAPVSPIGPGGVASAGPGQSARPGEGGGLTPQLARRDIRFAPRAENGRVTGIAVLPSGAGEGFNLAGFSPGDVIVQVNDRAVSSSADLSALDAQLAPGNQISLRVERGARVIPLSLVLSNR